MRVPGGSGASATGAGATGLAALGAFGAGGAGAGAGGGEEQADSRAAVNAASVPQTEVLRADFSPAFAGWVCVLSLMAGLWVQGVGYGHALTDSRRRAVCAQAYAVYG